MLNTQGTRPNGLSGSCHGDILDGLYLQQHGTTLNQEQRVTSWLNLKILSISVLQLCAGHDWNLGLLHTSGRDPSAFCFVQYSQHFTRWVSERGIPLKGWLLWRGTADSNYLLQDPSSWLLSWKQHVLSGSYKRHCLKSSSAVGVKLKVIGLVLAHKPDWKCCTEDIFQLKFSWNKYMWSTVLVSTELRMTWEVYSGQKELWKNHKNTLVILCVYMMLLSVFFFLMDTPVSVVSHL